MGCCSMKAEVIYDETWDVPTDVEKTKEFMCNWENLKVYIPDAQNGTFRDQTEDHFYFNAKGEENAPEVYIHTIKMNTYGNSYICDLPAVDPMATWKLTQRFTPNP